MRGMAEEYDRHLLDVMRICVNSWKAVTSKHIGRWWKSCGIVSVSDVADLTQLSGENIGKYVQDEEEAYLCSLMKQLTLDEQAQSFIDSDIASISSNALCEWMDIGSNINVKKEW